ncbi:MAG: tRNA (adenosine(37)-N6)-dimethylallyltransferase MiaA [Flammeovirgaceae bacterium]|nr:tRNA (adenosine(37)-N6)-dimethylallyltransferase MiaA [Flammeovirgaceae bacterium]MBR06423.1 tRNA (adenosine(37)-N6)-dimethylallyltransferase MiaA [Rickettsiales bacterium]|tara:strand:- start:696 stop:1613 length:918 start_codon:yes stop_codon:yes gene_type:complete
MQAKKNLLISVVGPTAVGKTKFAIELARAYNAEIVSADSRQFYKELEIGTAKPDADELAAAKHHFINSHSINDYYNVGQFEADVLVLLEELFQKNSIVIMVGGSGLFFKAVWEGFDEMPEVDLSLRKQLNNEFEQNGLEPLLQELNETDPKYYEQVDRQNHQRVIRALEVIRTTSKPFSEFRKGHQAKERLFTNVKIGLEMEREVLFDRINRRMDLMIEQGLFEEAERLMEYKDHNALQTVGYSEIFGYLDGEYDREEAVRLLKRNSRRYAKRQMTWFKRDEEIIWMQPNDLDQAIRLINKSLNA